MSTSRAFTYNTGTTITGTEQFGNIAAQTGSTLILTPTNNWFNGPDEDSGYTLCKDVPTRNWPTPDNLNNGEVKFWRSILKTDISFLDLCQKTLKESFPTALSAKTFANSIGYWSSWSETVATTMGLDWDESTDIYTRTGSLVGQTLAVSPGNANLPIHNNIKGCTLLNNGTVNYYLSATDWTKKIDGITASDLTGTDGQIMVEIPKFYYKYNYTSTTHNWSITSTPTSGYEIHPAFIKDNVEVNYRYCGAYEGVLYDTSASGYTNGGPSQIKDTTTITGDKLSSVSGYLPVISAAGIFGTHLHFRTIAKNRGAGWRQMDYDLLHAIQILYLIEYANFNSQGTIGSGVTNVTDYVAGTPFVTTGNGNSIGNDTGNNAGATTTTVEATKYIKYRGIEHLFGHISQWIDGIEMANDKPNISNNANIWTYGTGITMYDLSGYTTGQTCAATSGYANTIVPSSRYILALTTGIPADAHNKITDQYSRGSGWKSIYIGGLCNTTTQAGLFYNAHLFDQISIPASLSSRIAY
jgi:hypothetical protein